MKPSNVEVISDTDTWKMFKTSCSCSCPNHQLTVCVEKWDKEDKHPIISLYFEVGWRDKYHDSWLKRIKRKITTAYNVLFKGYINYDEEFIFRDENHFRDFIIAQLEAHREVLKNQQQEEKFNKFLVDVLSLKK